MKRNFLLGYRWGDQPIDLRVYEAESIAGAMLLFCEDYGIEITDHGHFAHGGVVQVHFDFVVDTSELTPGYVP
jgi:hypothetical protein